MACPSQSQADSEKGLQCLCVSRSIAGGAMEVPRRSVRTSPTPTTLDSFDEKQFIESWARMP
eukprot:3940143-Rhodomonas_salina.2